jgi:hypothetical protein
MVDRIKDKEELRLEAMFRSDPLPDIDFSKKVMTRLRRQIWVRRLAMPVAILLGGLIAFKPASELVITLSKVMNVLPASLTSVSVDIPSIPVESLPQVSTYLIGGLMILVTLFFVRVLED